MYSLLSMFRTFFSLLGYGVRWLFGVGKRARKWPMWVHRVLRYTLITIVFVLLCIFSPYIVSPGNVVTRYWWIREWWCGLFFLVTYSFIWLVVHLIHVMRLRPVSPFPDIEAAWNQILDALEKADANIDLFETPLFLVPGVSQRLEGSLFAGAGLRNVCPRLGSMGAPLGIYGDSDNLFLTAPGVFASSIQSSMAHGVVPGHQDTQRVQAGGGGLQGAADSEAAPFRPGQTLKPGESGARSRGGDASGGVTPLDQKQRELAAARLAYLCELIEEARAPRCSINGMLLVIPLEWIDPASRDQETCETALQDLQVVARKLQLQFPVVCIFSGLERLGDLTVFVNRMQASDRQFGPQMRAGSRFSMGHPIDAAASEWVIENAVAWFRSWSYAAFANDLDNPSNTELFRLLCQIDRRRKALANVLQQVFRELPDGQVPQLTGCYFIGLDTRTGRYAFVNDTIGKLRSAEDHVAWSPRLRERDRMWNATAMAVGIVSAALAFTNVVMLWMLWSE